METYYFSARQMTVGYDGKPLIKDIALNVKKGEILTLIGPNGAGKSTFFNAVSGIHIDMCGGNLSAAQFFY